MVTAVVHVGKDVNLDEGSSRDNEMWVNLKDV